MRSQTRGSRPWLQDGAPLGPILGVDLHGLRSIFAMQDNEHKAPTTAESARVRLVLDGLLADCVRQDASDLHLAPELPPYYRIHGILGPTENVEPVSAAELELLAQELARECRLTELGRIGSLDGALTS